MEHMKHVLPTSYNSHVGDYKVNWSNGRLRLDNKQLDTLLLMPRVYITFFNVTFYATI